MKSSNAEIENNLCHLFLPAHFERMFRLPVPPCRQPAKTYICGVAEGKREGTGKAHVATAAVKVESTFPKRAARHPGRPWRLRRQLVAVGGAATHLYGV